MKSKNLINRKFNRLTVISQSKTRDNHGQRIWKCKCDCGKISYHAGSEYRLSQIKSCGCSRRTRDTDSAYSEYLSDYKWGAKTRNLEFNLSIDEFKRIIHSNCVYCGIEPKNRTLTRNKLKLTIKVNGIDRKDNNKGYTKENSLACCEDCNRAKRNLTYEYFLSYINRLMKYNVF